MVQLLNTVYIICFIVFMYQIFFKKTNNSNLTIFSFLITLTSFIKFNGGFFYYLIYNVFGLCIFSLNFISFVYLNFTHDVPLLLYVFQVLFWFILTCILNQEYINYFISVGKSQMLRILNIFGFVTFTMLILKSTIYENKLDRPLWYILLIITIIYILFIKGSNSTKYSKIYNLQINMWVLILVLLGLLIIKHVFYLNKILDYILVIQFLCINFQEFVLNYKMYSILLKEIKIDKLV